MNVNEVGLYLPHMTSSVGYTLNSEQQTAIQLSLPVLKQDNKLDVIQFWGVIYGTQNDYLVAQGYQSHALLDVKTFCSQDGLSWVQLPDVDMETIANALRITKRFTGDLTHEFVYEMPLLPTKNAEKLLAEKAKAEAAGASSSSEQEEDEENEENEEEEEEENEAEAVQETQEIRLTEEVRLAATVVAINHDAVAVPRGAYLLTAGDQVKVNRLFDGLDVTEAQELSNYLHLRQPEVANKRTLLEQEALDGNFDFLDPIVDDVPEGSWSLKYNDTTGVAAAVSFLWPGAASVHLVSTNQNAYGYFGTGIKNHDIGFQLA